MRKLLIALMFCPLAALAQNQAPQGAQKGGDAPTARMHRMDPEQAQKRMRLARTLGLAEALDLDTAQALKLGDTLDKFDDKRKTARQQQADARDALRRAAKGEKTTAADVDGAIKNLLAARDQLHAIDRDMLTAVTKDLTPDKKARAALFLGSFRDRIERRVIRMGGPGMRGMGPGPGGPGMHGMGPGPGPSMGAGQEMRQERRVMVMDDGDDQEQVALCMNGDCPFDDGDEP